jgi:hypothetical protein
MSGLRIIQNPCKTVPLPDGMKKNDVGTGKHRRQWNSSIVPRQTKCIHVIMAYAPGFHDFPVVIQTQFGTKTLHSIQTYAWRCPYISKEWKNIQVARVHIGSCMRVLCFGMSSDLTLAG